MSDEVSFTGDQLQAIRHERGHLRIIACPGSGKTEVVSQRVAKLIENGVDPKTIVAFTFTEKAADQLKTRIRTILDKKCPQRADFGDMFIGTIHSFCFYMLKEIDPAFRSFDVLDDPKRVAFVSKFQNYYGRLKLDKLRESHGMSYYTTIYDFLKGADIIMTEDIDVPKLSDREFAVSYAAYRGLLEDEKYFDFSSIMHAFVQILKSDRMKLQLLNERVKHVIVDEYQDMNRIQEMLLELISEGADSVCVVGDDDQNIYHWRGSDVEIIRTFKERYGTRFIVSDVNLNTNFRSTEAVIHTARTFIEHNVKRLSKAMVSNVRLERKFEDGDIVHHHFKTDNDEFTFIVDKIRELHGADFIDKRNRPFSISFSDFAVLARTNDEAARIVNFLDASEIPCIAYSGTSVFERPVVELAMDCIGYVFSCRGYRTDDIPELANLKLRYGQIFSRLQYPATDTDYFASKLMTVRKQAAAIYAKSPKDYFGDLGLQGFYYKILNAMGAEDFDFGDVFNYSLAALSAAISDYESVWIRLRASEVKGFFFYVYAFARGHYTETEHSDATIIDAIHVLTIHKAKGLEFPVVFMPNFEKKRKRAPTETLVDSNLYDLKKYGGDEEDERRVYYTAITRSEKYLYITGSESQENRIKKNYVPHPFLVEMDKRYFSEHLSVARARSGYPPKTRSTGTFPTSFSHLICFDRCPHDFKLRHVYCFNAGVPVTFGYGTNIHNALNMIHNGYIRAKKIPSDQEIEKAFDRIFKLRYATDKIAQNMKKSAIQVVKNYVRLHASEFGRILETEKKFEFVLDDALVSGQIDLLKKVDESGKVTEVEIIDFKTDRNDSIYSGDYERQLRFYAIACLESLGLRPEKAYVHHLDEDKSTFVDISPSKLEETMRETKTQVAAILKRQFLPKPADAVCKECDYKVICPYKNFRLGIVN